MMDIYDHSLYFLIVIIYNTYVSTLNFLFIQFGKIRINM